MLPYQSHRQFPDRYLPGFPGIEQITRDAEIFMAPGHDPVYRLPGLRGIAETHRKLLRTLTAGYVGLRQEEHKLFLGTIIPDGLRLRGLIDDGRVPAEFHIAIGSVGAIPYYSGARTLDRTGLTDKHVARSAFVDGQRMMAHGKSATPDYAREAGADFWALGVHVCWNVRNPEFTSVFPGAQGVADAGDGYYLLGRLPQGFAETARRFPNLQLQPATPGTMYGIAQSLLTQGRPETAVPLFAAAAEGVKRLMPRGHQFSAVVQAGYGACLVKLKRHDDAEPLLLAAYATMRRSAGESHTATRQILADLVSLYEAVGRPDEANAYRRLLSTPEESSPPQ